jgi:transposase
LQLATFLYKNNIDVAVVNPLRIKRFSQMHLMRNKTDKADAKMIARYGENQQVDLWEPCERRIEESKDISQALEQMVNMRAGLKNKIQALKIKKASSFLIDEVQSQIKSLSSTIVTLEDKLHELVKSYDQKLYSNMLSISGIGVKTAPLLIITCNGFRDFDSAKQLICYYGLSPTETSSGTSIKRKGKISKMGNPLVRKKLYMCSLQASTHNKACCGLYQRLLAKGKPKNVALIAVANKLLKIAYAIAKSGLPYDNEYVSFKQPINLKEAV